MKDKPITLSPADAKILGEAIINPPESSEKLKTASKEFDDFMESVKAIPDYPELEGTINLCNDIISNREISDEEIENLLRERWGLSNELINACRWYREQLKKKQ